jgi:hypothetical protein
MRLKIFPWLGQEFVSLSCEGNGEGTIEAEVREVFARFSNELREFGLSLDHTVRTRLWARNMDCWQAGVDERARILSGKARSVSSSHIRPVRLGAKARIAVDMMAMRPPAGGESKMLREYAPRTNVLRSLTWGRILFCSGVSDMTHARFDEQFLTIIARLSETLRDGGGSWQNVARASFFLHHEESLDKLRESFGKAVSAGISCLDYTLIDTRQGKRLEIELTSTLAN